MDNQNNTYKYVMCTLRMGSITAAAKELGVSQPGLTSSLNAIEAKLGFKIFNRKAKPVELTREGSIYIEYLQNKDRLYREFEKQIADAHNGENVKIVIGAPAVYSQTVVARAVASFKDIYPDSSILIKNNPLPELIDQTLKGDMDCFISTSNNLPESIAINEITKESISICIPAKWDINKQLKGSDIKDSLHLLEGKSYISLDDSLPLQKEMNDFWKENNVALDRRIYVDQVSTGVALSAQGAGFCVGTQPALEAFGKLDAFCVYPLPREVSERSIYVAYDSTRYMSEGCRELIRILKESVETNNT